MKTPYHSKRERTAHLTSVVLLFVAAIVLYAGAGTASATQAQLIKIEPATANGKLDSITVVPDTIKVPKGTIAVWLSGVDQALVKVVFDDPAACQDVTADPKLTKFFTHWYDCYTTSYLPYGQTTSLKLTQPGVYPYTVKTEDGKLVAKGNIIVTAP